MKRLIAVLALVLVATSGALADQYFYAVDTNSQLYVVDVNNG